MDFILYLEPTLHNQHVTTNYLYSFYCSIYVGVGEKDVGRTVLWSPGLGCGLKES